MVLVAEAVLVLVLVAEAVLVLVLVAVAVLVLVDVLVPVAVAVLVSVGVAVLATVFNTQAENSEVLPVESVASAVMKLPPATLTARVAVKATGPQTAPPLTVAEPR